MSASNASQANASMSQDTGPDTTHGAVDERSIGARGIPVSPTDLMLRMVSQAVDAYLDLIAAIFGMNFDVIPLMHDQAGFWLTLSNMALIASSLAWFFWRKRYLARSGR